MMILKVKIADLAVLKSAGILITVGLGSCVGIALYDRQARVAGLAHVLLYDSRCFSRRGSSEPNPAKYADTAIPVLIDRMELAGADRKKIWAKISGGSQLFDLNKTAIRIGDKNVEMVKRTLKECSIPLIAEDTGGSCGRTMRMEVETGRVYITTIGREEKIL
ncbi:MAG: chemotaxis protein CheD [Firmicutes bacterium]|nr:chemotaxis protein CheD [Bacillota bacterium]